MTRSRLRKADVDDAWDAAWRSAPAERRRFLDEVRRTDGRPGTITRRRIAAELSSGWPPAVPPATGNGRLTDVTLAPLGPLLAAVVAAGDRLAEAAQTADSALAARPSSKPMRRLVPTDDVALDHPLVALALDDAMVGPVAAYLGIVPVLSYVDVWLSPATAAPPRSSQRWHLDTGDSTQLKVYVLCRPVTDDDGPVVWLDAPTTDDVIVRSGLVAGRLDDLVVDSAVVGSPRHRATGPAGEVWGVDTSRCLHHGSRVAAGRGPRVVAVLQYVTPWAFLLGGDHCSSAPYRHLADPGPEDDLGRLVLGAV